MEIRFKQILVYLGVGKAESVDKYQRGAHAKTAGVLQADEASL